MCANVPRQVLAKWADSLYAMGMSLPEQKLRLDLVNLAKSMYVIRDSQIGDLISVNERTILYWKEAIQKIYADEEKNTIIPKEVKEIKESIESFYVKPMPISPIVQENAYSTFLWKSVALAFTLWYGGQTFSLRKEELWSDLALNYNKPLKNAFDSLYKKTIFMEDKSSLVFFNPRFKTDVDASALLIVAQGVNLDAQLVAKKGYETLQAGFIKFSRSNHHPANFLYDSIRSYISDYCQRVFGNIFTTLSETNSKIDYALLRRLIIRFSLYPSLDFAVSGERNMEALLNKLVELKIALITEEAQQKFVLLKGGMLEQ